MKQIYLDNAASTPTDLKVVKSFVEAHKKYANPSSFNNVGREVKKELEKARGIVAKFLNARIDEVVFTSSGSESNNMVIKGLVNSGTEVITSRIEHPSILESLQRVNAGVRYLNVDEKGFVDLKHLERILHPKCKLVSIIYANNEIGTIQPIQKISKIIKQYNRKFGTSILFHIDACQAAGYLNMDVQVLGVDLLTFNSSKIYGPKGVAALYIRRGIKLRPLISGGSQEKGLRAGTENTPSIIGFAKAVLLVSKKEISEVNSLKNYMLEKLKGFSDVLINGPTKQGRLPNNINICVKDLESEQILLELDKYKIYAGSGSACTSYAVEPSHVLKAIGVPKNYINGAVRFSLGKDTTKKDIDYVLKVLPRIIKDLRQRNSKLGI